MTIPVSTAPAAKAWLFGQLQTAETPISTETFAVLYDNFTDSAYAEDELVIVGDITNRVLQGLAIVGGQGPSAFTETYRLNGLISVSRQAIYPQDANDRAWVLLAAVETVTRTDPTFGGLLVTSRSVETSSSVTPNENGNGLACEIPFAIECLAEL